MSSPQKKKVAVIGAGASGLVASQILSERQDFEHVVFERNSDIGGTWLYTDETQLDEQGHRVNSSVYKNLITNLPAAIMCVAGHPWPPDVDLHKFVPHEQMQQYLQSLVNQYDLRQYIRTNTAVKLIKPVATEERFPKILITVENVMAKTTEEFCFDAVLICTGAFMDPYIPKIEGLKKFKGKILHSCQYRSAEPFAGKHVIVVGSGPSAADIGLELSSVASITSCVSELDPFNFMKQNADGLLPASFVVASSRLASVQEKSIKLADGESVTADAIVFCTGYKFSYPFLHPDCGITVEDFKVSPLFKHTVCTKHPNIMFIGLPNCPIISMACWQIPLALKILDRTIELPTEEEMNADTEAEIAERKKCEWFRGREVHHFLSREFPPMKFIEDLAEVGNLPLFPKELQSLPGQVVGNVAKNFAAFRNEKYVIDGKMYTHHL